MVKPPFVDSNGMKKGAWSEEEDNKLRAYIERYGHWNWRLLPKYAGLTRCGKSCRLRWVNYLKPGVRRGNFTKQEEDLIAELHAQLGNKWSAIAAKLPGRTDNDIKNFWHTRIEKRRKQNPAAKKIVNNRHINEASSSKTQELEEEKPCQIKPFVTTLTESASSSDAYSLPFITEPSGSITDSSQMDFLPDMFLPSTQNEHIFPPLPEQEFLYSELHNYSELSTSESSYLSALDWIADDDRSIHSFDHVAQPLWTESFSSNNPNLQSENRYISPGEGEQEGFSYGHFLQYFDHGMNLFC